MKSLWIGAACAASLVVAGAAGAQTGQFTSRTTSTTTSTTEILDNIQVDPVFDRAAAALFNNQNTDAATHQTLDLEGWTMAVREYDNVHVIRGASGANFKAIPFGNLVTSAMVCNLSGHTGHVATQGRDSTSGQPTPGAGFDIAPKACWAPAGDQDNGIYEIDIAPSPDGGDWFGLVLYSR